MWYCCVKIEKFDTSLFMYFIMYSFMLFFISSIPTCFFMSFLFFVVVVLVVVVVVDKNCMLLFLSAVCPALSNCAVVVVVCVCF